jgi:prepilin-type N-terminal cleavage/methylation domain-containing protein
MKAFPMRRTAFTLIELLIVVIIMGIAAAIVVPMTSQANPLRLQALARQVVADVMQVQSDSIALQRAHAITFSSTGYVIAPITGSTVESGADVVVQRAVGGTGSQEYSNMTISANTFFNNRLVFDAMGCPVREPGSDVPASDGYVDVRGGTERFRIWVKAFTGGVEVKSVPVTP